MNFEEYLASKKIDSDTYKASEPAQWSAFETIFEQMHPKSFTLQKLNLINGIRREFPFVVEKTEQELLKKQVARPVMKTSSNASKKPAMKPKMTPDQKDENKEVAKPKSSMKPKMARPVMKPKNKEN